MKAIKFLFLGLSIGFIIMMLSQCSIVSHKATNDIAFDSIHIIKEVHLLDDLKAPHCHLEMNFSYPIKYENKETLKNLTDYIILNTFGENYRGLTPKDAVRQYTKDYLKAYRELDNDYKTDLKRASKELPIGSWYSYYENSFIDYTFNQKGLLSFVVIFENYTGGAHGSNTSTNCVFDLHSGQPISEKDIFKEGYEKDLSKLIIKDLVRQNDLTDKKELEKVGFFSVEEIYPNDNFLVSKKGLTYTYNEYEITPYAMSKITVNLPFKDLKPLLKDENPLTCLYK